MSAVPVIINGVMVPKARGGNDVPVPAVFVGYLNIQGLEVGGGPIIPDNPPPSPGVPTHPIVIPDPPPDIPPDPPEQPPANAVLVLKPAPVTGGWGLAADGGQLKWFFSPADSGAQPKRPGR